MALSRRSNTNKLVLLLMLISSSSQAQISSSQLPNMGEPADQTLSPQQEERIGATYMRQVRERLALINDPLLQEYLNGLGSKLLAHADNPGYQFHFFIVNDEQINAHAAPGGYIGINSGLWLAAQNEAQFAGVIAHEIAHVTQRHIARAYAASQANQGSIAAGILAALVIGSQNPQAGQAALAASIAAGQQLQINYTRTHETEADRIGIALLAHANFDPIGMSEFFQILGRKNGEQENSLYALLRTHPLSRERVIEADARVLNTRKAGQSQDSLEFQLARMRLRVLGSPDLPSLKRQLLQSRAKKTISQHYGLALSHYLLHDYAAAHKQLQQVNKLNSDNVFAQLLSAEIYYAQDRRKAGDAVYEEILSLYPDHASTLYSRALALELVADFTAASQTMRRAIRTGKLVIPEHYRTLARLSDKAGHKLNSLEALADYHLLSGEPRLAVLQLEKALKQKGISNSDTQRISARLEKIREDHVQQLQAFPG